MRADQTIVETGPIMDLKPDSDAVTERMRLLIEQGVSVRNARITVLRALGMCQQAVADTEGIELSRRTVRNVLDNHAEELADATMALKMAAVRRLAPRFDEVMDALIDTSANSEARHQPQAARVVGEFTNMIGGSKSDVHIGDRYETTNQIDARQVKIEATTPEERAERLAELRARITG